MGIFSINLSIIAASSSSHLMFVLQFPCWPSISVGTFAFSVASFSRDIKYMFSLCMEYFSAITGFHLPHSFPVLRTLLLFVCVSAALGDPFGTNGGEIMICILIYRYVVQKKKKITRNSYQT